jgi:hypothetical protein
LAACEVAATRMKIWLWHIAAAEALKPGIADEMAGCGLK